MLQLRAGRVINKYAGAAPGGAGCAIDLRRTHSGLAPVTACGEHPLCPPSPLAPAGPDATAIPRNRTPRGGVTQPQTPSLSRRNPSLAAPAAAAAAAGSPRGNPPAAHLAAARFVFFLRVRVMIAGSKGPPQPAMRQPPSFFV
ncbi:rho GTPase-activating protein 17-like [Schistocerca gregaria]|uniref:rho GTPase-activating protein 17-like n=1 Tax=Schistocerca gregaria TaxID=7010 RepID=UPI00211E855C|nr:rho GTPase-activating protein 17-like [Schistocerca gregaria]